MRVLIPLLLLAVCGTLRAEKLPEWMIPLREATYEQKLKADDIRPLYAAAQAEARRHYSGAALNRALSRCEYYMGRVYQDNNRNDEARVHYHEGIRLAEEALKAEPGAAAWAVLTENLSQACSVGPWSYTVANGLNVEKFAKNALAFDPRNAAAHYAIAARWVFAPAPLHHYRRGIEMMRAILDNCDMDKEDYFNVYSAIGYGYVQQKKYEDARPWLLQALAIYPTNKYATEMLGKK